MNYFSIYIIFLHTLYCNGSVLRSKEIIGGENAEKDQYTYTVSLQYQDKHLCGGGIISDQHILTAAHCVLYKNGFFSRKNLVAVFGTNNLKQLSDSVIKIAIEKVYVRDEFKIQWIRSGKPYRPPGDIAVIRLQTTIGLTNRPDLKKLLLPQDPTQTFEGRKAIISGYGYDRIESTTDPTTKKKFTKGSLSGQLHYSEVKIISNDACIKKKTELIHPSDLCARIKQNIYYDSPKGTCFGDSGSPLVSHGLLVIGVLARAPAECNESYTPTVYIRTASYKTFIENAIRDIVTSDMRVATLYSNQEDCEDPYIILIETLIRQTEI